MIVVRLSVSHACTVSKLCLCSQPH